MSGQLNLCSCSRVLLSVLLKALRMKALEQLVYMVIYFAHEMQNFFLVRSSVLLILGVKVYTTVTFKICKRQTKTFLEKIPSFS